MTDQRLLLRQRLADALDGVGSMCEPVAPLLSSEVAQTATADAFAVGPATSRRPKSARVSVTPRRRHWIGGFSGAIGALIFGMTGAIAFLTATDSSNTFTAAAAADSLPQGATPNTPTTTPNPKSNTVVVTFPQASTAAGHTAIPASDYGLKRYPYPSGSAVSVAASCSGIGTITCTESSVPDGKWQYTDTPRYGTNWVGAESAGSSPVIVDTTPPIVAVTYPLNGHPYGANWNGSVAGTASDATSGVASVRVSIEDTTGTPAWWGGSSFNQSSQTFVAASGTTTWSLTFPAADLTSGHSYSVIAQATDSVGNVGSSTSVTFTYSTAPPSVAVTYPVNNTTYGANWTGAITGTAGANATGASIAGVKVSVQQGGGASSCWTGTDGTYTAACPNYVAVTSGSTSWSLSLSAAELTAGDTYHVLAQATDSVGNVGASTSVTFTYSTAPPSVAVTYPVNNATYGANWTGAITGTSGANATGASIAGVKVSVQQGGGASSCWTGTDGIYTAACPNYVAVTSGSTSWSLSLSAAELTAGDTYHVLAQATDTAGNVGTSSSVTFTYSGAGGLVQTIGGTCNNCTSLTLTPSSPTTAGDLLVVSAFEQDGKSPIITVSDSANDTYTEATANPQDNKWGVFAYTSGASSVTHITVTVSGSSPTIAASFAEFSGYTATLDTSNSTNSGMNTGTTPSASISTSNAQDLLIGAVGWDTTATLAQATGFVATDTQSIVGTNSPVSESLSFERVTSTGSYVDNPTLSTSSHWTEFLFAFKHS